jgi:hypothetical protein
VCGTGDVEVEGFGWFGCLRDVHVDVGWPWLFGEVFWRGPKVRTLK